jgi:hypothetical protein
MKTTNTNKPGTLTKVARIVSVLTNPPMFSVLVLFLISFTKSNPILTSTGWWIEVVIFLVLLPLVYLYIRVITSKSQVKFPLGIIAFLKQHPLDVLMLSIIFGVPCLIILVLFGAPIMNSGPFTGYIGDNCFSL